MYGRETFSTIPGRCFLAIVWLSAGQVVNCDEDVSLQPLEDELVLHGRIGWVTRVPYGSIIAFSIAPRRAGYNRSAEPGNGVWMGDIPLHTRN